MARQVDFSKLKASWTKYDIVQVMDVIASEDRIERYKKKQIEIDEPILRSFLGINKLTDPTPQHWIEIQKYPSEKKLFALLSVLFTHGSVVDLFANQYSNLFYGGGIFRMQSGKQFTNIRSALVEAGAAESKFRKSDAVHYDFSNIYTNGNVGRLFKQVLEQRINKVTKSDPVTEDFYAICFSNNFHKALGLSELDFQGWLEGSNLTKRGNPANVWIEEVEIEDFYSIKEALLNFNGSKEVYFLGENGDGKSLVLMATYLAFNGNYVQNSTDFGETGDVADMIKKLKPNNLLGIDANGEEYHLNRSSYVQSLFAYGTHRGRYSTDNPEKYGFMSLFSIDEQLHNPVSWLIQQKAGEIGRALQKGRGFQSTISFPATQLSVSLLEEILNDVLEKNVRVEVDVSGVSFIEKGRNISFSQLSEGYRSILIFVVDLMIRLRESVFNLEASLDSIKGVVLIDEIDQHLHPKWQRVILGKLRSIFPQVQFIMTTHSPTIIQGASDDAMIYRVYRDPEDGNTKISEPYYRKELDHLMINSLVTHPMFGLDDARMDSENDQADTSDSYLLYRINKKIEADLKAQKKTGKKFISDQEIDDLIQKIMKEEFGDD